MHIPEDILSLRESYEFEVKQAQGRHGEGEIPQSIWPTYSAFANTDGGYILLGASEDETGNIIPLGLTKPEKVLKCFWDNVNNKQIISQNLLQEHDVQIVMIESKALLLIYVPRALRTQRPVFAGENPLTGTFRRNYEGDYRCDIQTVHRMIAEAQEETRDSRILRGFSLDDVQTETLSAYRNAFASTKPSHPWIGLDSIEFLRQLGGWSSNRQNGEEGLTVAGLLMFGKMRSILDGLPNYIVDYQEKSHDEETDTRWIDRLTTDGTWSGNLFDFYRRVYLKITSDLKIPFRLIDGQHRTDETHVHEALREALVNTLIHADYSGSVGILVVKQPHKFFFRNPGGLRLPLDEIYSGGTSDCRNRNLQKMFQLVGAGEQAGSGFARILQAWSNEQHWITPLLKENIQPEYTTLQLPMTSLIPQSIIDGLDKRFGERFRQLNHVERLTMYIAHTTGKVTNEQIRGMTTLHPRDITQVLKSLVQRGFLIRDGVGRGMCYLLPESNHLQPHLFDTSSSTNEVSSIDNEVTPVNNGVSHPTNVVSLLKKRLTPQELEEAIVDLCKTSTYAADELANLLDRSKKTILKTLTRLVREGKILQLYPDRPNHPEQKYHITS
jgi:predicted HTH transcriptional regulator